MTVLITGGTGFVGSHVVRQLQSRGTQPRLLVRDLEKARAYYQQHFAVLPEFFVGDVSDADSVRQAMQGCDAVVHSAALTPINSGSTDELFAVNVGGTETVMGTAVALGVKHMVYVSSVTAIFDADGSKVHENAELCESSMPYGKSKVAAERYVRELQARHSGVSIVYPGGIIGPEDPGFSDAFKALHHRINNGFRIIDDGGMQHIDVRDLSALIASLLIEGGEGRFLIPGVYCKWSELADIIEEVSGCTLNRIAAKGWKLRLIGKLMDVMRLVKTVDTPVSAETMRYATLWPKIANSRQLAERGISLRPPRETFEDSIRWMLESGYLQPEQVPKLRQAL